MEISRRDLLRMTALGAVPAALADNGCFGARLEGTALAASTRKVDIDVELRAVASSAVLEPGVSEAGPVLRFEARLLSGPASALSNPSSGYLGPTFRVRRGQRLRVRFTNALTEPSIVHWHGLHVSQENDGHPRFAVAPGRSYVYEFDVEDRPGTYWYHPHPDLRTATQVYGGLAGLFIVEDPDDVGRGLPAFEQELLIVLQDRVLDAAGQLVYRPNAMLGMLGDRIFVNGLLASTPISVKAGSHRLRVLNGSNARIYKLAWSDGSPLTVIGTDGGLLSAPLTRPYAMLAPAQRLEIWADFGRTQADDVWLQSATFSAGAGMGMGGNSFPANGAPMSLCRFTVRGRGQRLKLPSRLLPVSFRPREEVRNLSAPRTFAISMARMRWTLNGRTFDMNGVAPNERVKLDTTEDWEFDNSGGMMTMPHPIHLHGGQFQVVARSTAPGFESAADSVRLGLLDEGLRDTVLVMPGERVKVRMRFDRHAGLFLYHCHNLEHEDAGMMRNYLVET